MTPSVEYSANRILSMRSGIALVATTAALLFASAASAQQTSGYITDQRGQVVKSGFGLCWRTGYWTPAMSTQECDPDLVPKKATPVAAPAVKAPTPSTPPKPAARPTPVSEKVTLAADTLFDFDKAVIRSDGRTKLDELAARIKGVDVDTIIVIGHTDRIGGNAYNMKLSRRRADAVKGYLVSKGIPANRIYTEGKGKKQPKTKPGQCKGPKSKKVIACLQPDRRVDVEVVGSRTK
jgi:OOP family OmpA-OmpF porin